MSKPHQIVFRTDGGPKIGLGHVMRCIALAEALARRGHFCRFAGAVPAMLQGRLPGGAPLAMPGGAEDWASAAFRALTEDSDLLVTDHYALDAAWQARSPVPVVAITDPPYLDQHGAMMVLPTAFTAPPAWPDALLAPDHCLIRAEFAAARRAPKRGARLLVSAGGGADAGLTERIVDALASDPKLAPDGLTVVLGTASLERRARVADKLAGIADARIVEHVADMASLTDAHDIAIGAPGGSALERACLGLAQILIPIAGNQLALAVALAERGAALVLPAEADAAEIADAIRRAIDDPALRAGLAASGFALVDGRGSERVADAIESRLLIQ